MVQNRLYAGRQLRQLRDSRNLRQSDFATKLGISASYLSQIEHDDRPLTPVLLDRLQKLFPLEWEEVAADAGDRRAGALREAAADPLFAAAPLPPEQLERAALQQPQLTDQFVTLHAAYRRAGERLQIIDEALTGGTAEGGRRPG
ncbi:MAG TPA: helix-turn-helix transcriptional regulator, partial [Sphingopyxis sp.]|nr:helix-turn-helix transcriptional regulator [Sphingopyxis sp.]